MTETTEATTEHIAILAHELKGPLVSLEGFAKLLTAQWDGLSSERRERALEVILRETGRLNRLVDDLLDVSRIQTGRLTCDLTPEDLGHLIWTTVDANGGLATRHDVVISVADDLPAVMVDKDRICQVLLNLLTNAVRYSPEGSSVTIGATHDGDEVRVSVSDEGVGIAPDEAARMFEKFARASSNGNGSGHGLGLYIARALVEAHGGRMWVESHPGDGATFFFTLKVAR